MIEISSMSCREVNLYTTTSRYAAVRLLLLCLPVSSHAGLTWYDLTHILLYTIGYFISSQVSPKLASALINS